MNLEAEQAIMVGDDIGELFFFITSKLYFIIIMYIIYYLFIKKCFFQNYSTL